MQIMSSRAVRLCIGATLAATSIAALTIEPASATVSTSYCNGRSYKAVVKNYTRGSASLPLRCGTSTWGFRHITSRWNADFDSMIALTISRGEAVPDVQQDGGSKIYALFDNNCNELFRVIYNGGAYNGNDVKPQGIITAYDERTGTAVTPGATQSGAVEPSYRTDCSVIQNI